MTKPAGSPAGCVVVFFVAGSVTVSSDATGLGLPDREPPPPVPTSKGAQGGTAMRRRIAALTVTALLTGAAGISAQIYAPEPLERDFRLEWQVTRGRKGPDLRRDSGG